MIFNKVTKFGYEEIKKIKDHKYRIIGPNVKTGINVSIMCGKVIGENSRIGAHTLVDEDVAPNTVYYHDQDSESKKKLIEDFIDQE